MLLSLLGIIDIFAGISLLYPNFLGFYIGMLLLLKGAYSMSSLVTKNVMITAMGIIDIAAGLSLVLDFSIPLLWLVLVVKGSLTLIQGLGY